MRFFQSRIVAVVLAALVVVGLGAGGAVAGSLITSRDIKNHSVRGVDLKDNSIGRRQIRLMGIGVQDLGSGVLLRFNRAEARDRAQAQEIRSLRLQVNRLEAQLEERQEPPAEPEPTE